MRHNIIAVTNQKGGVGKTTTSTTLAHALALSGCKVLLIDLDPQGNATQGLGVSLETIEYSVSDLIRDKDFPIEKVIYQGPGLDLIPATPALATIERLMPSWVNPELRLAHRLKSIREQYTVIILDSPPTLGSLLKLSLNAAQGLILPVDCGFYAMMGIKEMLSEIEIIKSGTNPELNVLGYLCTMFDHTKIAQETWDGLVSSFGDLVFETRIRRSVKLKEAPALGKTIFHHAPESAGAHDYLLFAQEVCARLGLTANESALVETASSPSSNETQQVSVAGDAQ